jgi:2-polyprenyl-6-methoxyphenol hydroxylase-like FAD-dependent oxidoreductase
MDSLTDVVIVGAGPTGLMLAGDLARAGVGCTVLERRAEETNLTRAFAVHARTLELLDARGLADDLVATGVRVGALRLFGQLEVDLSRLPTRFPYVLVTPQYHTEGVLEAYASALGAQIARAADVVDLRQDTVDYESLVTLQPFNAAPDDRDFRAAPPILGSGGKVDGSAAWCKVEERSDEEETR